MDTPKSRFLRSWRLLILVSQLFGITFFRDRISFVVAFVYRFIILAILIAILVDQLPIIIYWTRLQPSKVDAMLQIMKLSIAWTNYFLNFLLTCFKNREIWDIINILVHLDLNLPDKVFRKLCCRQIRRFILIYALILTFQILSVPLSPPQIRKGHSSVSYIFIDSLTTIVILQFVEFVMFVREYYVCLNTRLTQLREELITEYGVHAEDKACKEVNRLRILHFTLIDTCRMMNNVYQIQILLVLIRCFIEATTVLAALIDEGAGGSVLSYIFRVVGIVVSLLLIWLIGHCCHLTVEESKLTASVVSTLANNVKSESVRDELRIFTIQTLQVPVDFTVFQFFSLNHEIMTKVIISISSYIIIIYTFQLSHEN
ncbi:UNVERIFIED_CONTAM: hypothetical protein PYX00_002976 [Menopon gallinae]|uniref:Gustatory receptor n=1 Tax=Menopon gallinae TaxID=328185 RepID=A0AAW2HYJ8_9NEOP